MIGPVELLVVALIGLLIFVASRRGGSPSSSRQTHVRVGGRGALSVRTLLVVVGVAAATGGLVRWAWNWMWATNGGLAEGAVGGAVAGAVAAMIVALSGRKN